MSIWTRLSTQPGINLPMLREASDLGYSMGRADGFDDARKRIVGNMVGAARHYAAMGRHCCEGGLLQAVDAIRALAKEGEK